MAASSVHKFFRKVDGKHCCMLCTHESKIPPCKSTGNLILHLTSVHGIDRKCMDAFPVSTQQTLSISRAPSGSDVRRLVMSWLIQDLRPLSLVDSDAFRSLLGVFEASGHIPHSTNLTRRILPSMYKAMQKHIADQLREATVSYMFDGWSDKFTTASYLTLSACAIKKHQLVSYCLGMNRLKQKHTKEYLAGQVKAILADHGVDISKAGSCLAATTDNASNMKATVQQLGHLVFPCMAHTLSLIVQEVFTEDNIAELVQRLHKVVKHFRKSSNASLALEQAIQQCYPDIAKRYAEVKGIKADSVRDVPRRLQKMVATRWHSAYDMLTTFYVLFPAVSSAVQVLATDRGHTLPVEALKLSSQDNANIVDLRAGLADVMHAITTVQTHKEVIMGRSLTSLMFVVSHAKELLGGNTQAQLTRQILTKIVVGIDARFWSLESAFRAPQIISSTVLPACSYTATIRSAFDVALVAGVLDPSCRDIILRLIPKLHIYIPPPPGSTHADPTKSYVSLLLKHAALIGASLEDQQQAQQTIDVDELMDQAAPEATAAELWWSQRSKKARIERMASINDEITGYLSVAFADPLPMALAFWADRGAAWPQLARIATRFLAVYPTSAEVERMASTAGDVLTHLRSNLTPEHVQMLVCLAKNLRSGVIPPEVFAHCFV